MRAVGEVVALAAAVHRPVVGRLRHQRENLRVDIVREHAVELEVEERLLDRARGLDRLHHESRQAPDGLAAVAAGEGRGLIHRSSSLTRSKAAPICGELVRHASQRPGLCDLLDLWPLQPQRSGNSATSGRTRSVVETRSVCAVAKNDPAGTALDLQFHPIDLPPPKILRRVQVDRAFALWTFDRELQIGTTGWPRRFNLAARRTSLDRRAKGVDCLAVRLQLRDRHLIGFGVLQDRADGEPYPDTEADRCDQGDHTANRPNSAARA